MTAIVAEEKDEGVRRVDEFCLLVEATPEDSRLLCEKIRNLAKSSLETRDEILEMLEFRSKELCSNNLTGDERDTAMKIGRTLVKILIELREFSFQPKIA